MAAADVLPSYEQATRSRSSTASPFRSRSSTVSPFLEDTESTERNGIPVRTRRSMEDELRPLPDRWAREFDPATGHQFFVDTVSAPPRAIWHHPHDDNVYMSSISDAEREAINSSFPNNPHGSVPIHALDGGQAHHPRCFASRIKDTLTRRHSSESNPHHTHSKIHAQQLGTIPTETEQDMEREMHRQHLLLRRAMTNAMNTSEAQLLGQDDTETNVYLEPPGHMFPGVDTARVRHLSPYFSEVFYEPDPVDKSDRFPGPEGRYLRPRGEMYGYGYGGYGCGKWGGGRWSKPEGEPERGRTLRRGTVRKARSEGGGREVDGQPLRMRTGSRSHSRTSSRAGFKRGLLALPMMAPMFGGMVLGSLMV
ncbi:hypothetical protein V8F06_010887 [Rhypophila decipiens]